MEIKWCERYQCQWYFRDVIKYGWLEQHEAKIPEEKPVRILILH